MSLWWRATKLFLFHSHRLLSSRARRLAARLQGEVLEDRVLLTGSPSANVFAQYSGLLAHPGNTARVPFPVTPNDFTLGPSKNLILGFQLKAGDGSALDPA